MFIAVGRITVDLARLAALALWYGVVAVTAAPRLVRVWRHMLIPDEDLIGVAVTADFLGDDP